MILITRAIMWFALGNFFQIILRDHGAQGGWYQFAVLASLAILATLLPERPPQN